MSTSFAPGNLDFGSQVDRVSASEEATSTNNRTVLSVESSRKIPMINLGRSSLPCAGSPKHTRNSGSQSCSTLDAFDSLKQASSAFSRSTNSSNFSAEPVPDDILVRDLSRLCPSSSDTSLTTSSQNSRRHHNPFAKQSQSSKMTESVECGAASSDEDFETKMIRKPSSGRLDC